MPAPDFSSTQTAMPFIPADFSPPRTVSFERFRLEVLSPAHATPDFDAVRSSQVPIEQAYGPKSWWVASLTYKQNLDDLIRHEREFDERARFAYAILSASGDDYLGCVYIGPDASERLTTAEPIAGLACVTFWLSAKQSTLDDNEVLLALNTWLSTAWPLARSSSRGDRLAGKTGPDDERATIGRFDVDTSRGAAITSVRVR